MADFEIATIGDNCIDRFTGSAGFSLVGGNAVNVAVQLSRLGRRVAYFGAVADDRSGARTIRALADNGVITNFVRTRPGITAYTIVEQDAQGDRRFAFEEFGVCAAYRPDSGEMRWLTDARHVHIGWLNDRGAVRRRMSAAGVSVSQDISVNAEPWNIEVDGLDVVFASHDGSLADARHRAGALVAAGARLAVVMRGANGSLALDGSGLVSASARIIAPIDTTGAGDGFIAGFLDARLKGLPLMACLEAGHALATNTCLHLGGFPQAPEPLAAAEAATCSPAARGAPL